MLLRVNGLAAASSLKQRTPAGITVLSLRKSNDSKNVFLTALHEIQFNHGNEIFACNSFGIFINDCKHYFIFTLGKFSQSYMREKKRGVSAQPKPEGLVSWRLDEGGVPNDACPCLAPCPIASVPYGLPLGDAGYPDLSLFSPF